MEEETTKKNAIEFLTVLMGLCKEYKPRFSFRINGLHIYIGGLLVFEGYMARPAEELQRGLDKLKGGK